MWPVTVSLLKSYSYVIQPFATSSRSFPQVISPAALSSVPLPLCHICHKISSHTHSPTSATLTPKAFLENLNYTPAFVLSCFLAWNLCLCIFPPHRYITCSLTLLRCLLNSIFFIITIGKQATPPLPGTPYCCFILLNILFITI